MTPTERSYRESHDPGRGTPPSGSRLPDPPTLTLVGTGTLVPDPRRGGPAHHLRWGSLSLLLDCGPGALQGMVRSGVAWQELTHVALSHYHTDHTGALASLLWALTHGCVPPRATPLTVMGPPGLLALRDGLARAHGEMILGSGFPVRWHEVGRHDVAELTLEGGPVGRLLSHPTPHTESSVAWRVEVGTWMLGYTGDTGPDDALGPFFGGCDVVVCECSTPDDTPLEGHLSPQGVAALARAARCRCVLLTHVYPPHEPDALAGAAGRGADGVPVHPGRDGMRVRLDAPDRLDPAGPYR